MPIQLSNKSLTAQGGTCAPARSDAPTCRWGSGVAKGNWVAAAALVLVASAVPAAQGQSREAQVRQVIEQYLHARNTANEAEITALFTADADQLVSTGTWRRGRDNLVKGAMASSKQEGGNSTITINTVRFVMPEVALADGNYETRSKADAVTAPRRMQTSFVLVRKEGEGWKISAIRNMLPAANNR